MMLVLNLYVVVIVLECCIGVDDVDLIVVYDLVIDGMDIFVVW